jgi:hypothetical protein
MPRRAFRAAAVVEFDQAAGCILEHPSIMRGNGLIKLTARDWRRI